MARRLKNLPTTDKKFVVVKGLNKKKVVNPFYAGDYSFTDERPANYKRSSNEGNMKMARRGRKAKAANASRRVSRRQRTVRALRGLFGATPYSETKSYGPRRPRGRRPGTRNAAPAPVVVVQESYTPGYTKPIGPRRPRGRRPGTRNQPKRGGLVRRTTSRVKNYFRKGKTMPRGRKGNKGTAQPSYSQVTSSLPIQVSIQVAEGLGALASVATDIYTTSTKSATDDYTFPIAEYAVASAGRYIAQKYLSRKHPGLAVTLSHFASSANGDRIGNVLRQKFSSFLKPSGPPAGGPSGK